uniref:Uncharacterized protein n=1 Tax=Hemiselmis tepida TaxID=464990 RepID=A0A7S0VWF9_9CRYP
MQKGAAQAPSVEALEKNVGRLTRLLNKASSKAERDEEAEQEAKSSLDKQRAALAAQGTKKLAKSAKGASTEDARVGKLAGELHAATAKADAAEMATTSLKKQLNKQVEALADAQIRQHRSASGGEDFVAHVVDHAAQPALAARMAKRQQSGVLGIAEPKLKGAEVPEGTSELSALHTRLAALTSTLAQLQDAEKKLQKFADVGASLLSMPGVQRAVKQSLSQKDVVIAQEIAKSLNVTFDANEDMTPEMVAEAAIAAEEAGSKEGVPHLNFTSQPLGDEVAATVAQAEKEIEIEKKNS